MIIWGWGRVTKRKIGQVFQRTCSYCNTTAIWNLCIVRTWFTLFFIPVIPYRKRYCVVCPSCGSYIELTEAQFEELKQAINSSSSNAINEAVPEVDKYAGKTETQKNYLKQMEEYRNSKAE
ncbi:hypothetical protein BJV85_002638 [Clostridium acetobutylicum]|uniref:Uncharacterized predicted metal-binding protein n=1 Tax=Clostridium acetobutylicum (strain ATCC 824 / DSM 792 / JCM 1419 / IAM 19013 / LMG 5710 / NBRC 13948 / NRRL B-527 / VKM B-1787 / 2291 / W) TaxID=272562 RepID=Q97JC9_CLOAB|nr:MULTISPECIES: zinc-ribbon domain-containing protein [Clostridium]AAK79325.1 Uncharacterized predicted metal-binding protein [Clostridium acetobutylicum ATCC 824]ADZ20408.1 Conserved hypothetical protein [Clostridium acetobutylicum EA 2018]AEI31778.1 hypothetical protein SMB_G1380 [Clostridium acetobutylicum DSM 1731]AWV81424.1 zinc-ribbon domain-containing protein [Clostridium acetobutylicum]KHD36101.1 hypothetical protein NL50_09985 [Clostridium acetobutylicum]